LAFVGWTLARRPSWRRPVPRRTVRAKRGAKFDHTAAQFVVGPAKLFRALQFVSRDPEPGEHSKKQQAVPELQSPPDGLENHRQPSMQ
jgi:hypothetical protein